MKITIIIPILNEQTELSERLPVLMRLKRNPFVKSLIFSDSGSTDNSLAILEANNLDFEKVTLPPAHYKNHSPSIAKALLQVRSKIQTEYAVILPIDTDFTDDHILKLISLIPDNPDSAFVFSKKYNTTSLALRLSAFLLKTVRERLFSNFVWTNVFCIRNDDLALLKPEGFLEDVILCDELKKHRKIVRINLPVTVSPRKYIKDGPWFRFILNVFILFFYRLKVFEIKTLRKFYKLSIKQQIRGETYEFNETMEPCFSLARRT